MNGLRMENHIKYGLFSMDETHYFRKFGVFLFSMDEFGSFLTWHHHFRESPRGLVRLETHLEIGDFPTAMFEIS